ncbi:Ceramidase [Corchorus olitorius]|uniref:Ceramidase n=1 Tax=Corchorus olitorius TaxID=93759 RepID=A0A1R3K389_9ROSI|nr:Ceramidase [Corchorus olitorius]
MGKRTVYAWAAAAAIILCFIVLMRVTPAIPQPQYYHNFADKRQFFGIPNTLNVVSNLTFIVIGITGLVLCHYKNYFNIRSQGERWGWTCFYIGVITVGLGSAYYHLEQNHPRLLWDRLPMTIAFTSLMAILITERVDEQMGTFSIIPLLLAGVISSLFYDDLRPYTFVQFVACVAVPLMAMVLPPKYTHSTYWLLAAGFYPLALLNEGMDRVVYTLTFHLVSGHTLKHLCAAMVPVILSFMLANRTVETQRRSLLDTWKASRTKVKENGSNPQNGTYTQTSSVPADKSD